MFVVRKILNPSINIKIKKNTNLLYLIIITAIFVFFYTKRLIYLFFLFEIVFFPVVFLILGWGYQVERLQASNYFLVYRFFCSLPFIIILLIIVFFFKTSYLFYLFLSGRLVFLLFLPFLVKTPIFLLHLWLPKAHVEAPTGGSIVLAAVLLKIGGYGLVLIRMLSKTKEFWIFLVGFLGAFFRSFICCFQSDLKAFVAYSSVAHINFIIICLFCFTFKRERISFIIIITHGFISGLLFFIAGASFYFVFSRNMYFISFFRKQVLFLFIFFYLILLANFSVPPFLSFFSEVLGFVFLCNTSSILSVFLFLYAILVCYFCVFLLILFFHTKTLWRKVFTLTIKERFVGGLAVCFLLNYFSLYFF